MAGSALQARSLHSPCLPCRHKNIITFYGVVQKPNEVLLVTEVSSALLPNSNSRDACQAGCQ